MVLDLGDDDAPTGFDDLYPAVLECFAVIFLGYIAGRAGIISSSESKGLNTFIGTFSLPALIFLSMAQLDLRTVNWIFLLSIFLAKACIFGSVIIISLLVSKPKRLDKAGLFAIFCTQSNDFALGYPIIAALYGKTHPDYARQNYYILRAGGLGTPKNAEYLCQTCSFSTRVKRKFEKHMADHGQKLYTCEKCQAKITYSNNFETHSRDFAFTLMEIAKQKNLESQELPTRAIKGTTGGTATSSMIARRVLRGVVLNPVVLMTALGIIGNGIFSHCIPRILEGILKVLGSAFSASALFSLGLTMVGSAASLKGSGFVVPGILIAIKLLVMPLVSREFVSLLEAGVDANETVSLSNYAFLYGTFPTAPGVFVYATQYDMAVQLVSGALIACTFLSAPLMFVSAKMLTFTNLDPRDYVTGLDSFLFNMSILGLVASFWVIVVFILSRKWKKVPHCITLCLVISQAIACVGAILWSSIGVGGNKDWRLFLQFGVFAFGVFSSRIWTAILAASLVFLRCRSLCFVLKLRPYMGMIGWGIPAALVTVLMLTVKNESLDVKQDPNFQYGETQALVAVMVLVVSFIVTVGCLIMQQRYERQYAQYSALFSQNPTSDSQVDIEGQTEVDSSCGIMAPPSNAPSTSSSTATLLTTATVAATNVTRPISVTTSSSPINRPTRASLIRSTCAPSVSGCCQEGNASGCNKFPMTKSKSDAGTSITEIEDLGNIYARKIKEEPEDDDDDEILFSYNDDLCSPSKHPCNTGQRKSCTRLLERYRSMNQLTEPAEIGIVRDRDDEFQMMRHIILLLLLCCSMFVGIGLCLWTLITEKISGIYVELVFLDAALNFGQGFCAFLLFGLNTKMIIMPLHKWWRRLAFGEGSVNLPKWEELTPETKNTCEQFLTYHIDKCTQDIVRDRKWRMETFESAFCGHELVDWLLLVGLSRDRNEAIKYGRHLLAGRVIRHVKNLHHFYDQPFFYTFQTGAL